MHQVDRCRKWPGGRSGKFLKMHGLDGSDKREKVWVKITTMRQLDKLPQEHHRFPDVHCFPGLVLSPASALILCLYFPFDLAPCVCTPVQINTVALWVTLALCNLSRLTHKRPHDSLWDNQPWQAFCISLEDSMTTVKVSLSHVNKPWRNMAAAKLTWM